MTFLIIYIISLVISIIGIYNIETEKGDTIHTFLWDKCGISAFIPILNIIIALIYLVKIIGLIKIK